MRKRTMITDRYKSAVQFAAPLRVSCSDKLHNARAILADYEIEGERL